jgi:cell wall-associated NlpC family hydrolase
LTNFNDEQMTNARLIIAVGNEMHMSSRDIMTALMAAMQESSLRNISYGSSDSLGLFQQRPSQGWGTRAQILNPIYATQKFFHTLAGVKDRGNLSMGQAAQAVQRSAYPTAYNQWENDARRMLTGTGGNGGLPFPVDRPTQDLSVVAGGLAGTKATEQGVGASTAATPGLGSTTTDSASPGAPGSGATTQAIQTPTVTTNTNSIDDMAKLLSSNGTGQRSTVINAAQKWLGTPYLWGGGNPNGPTSGIGHGTHTVTGFDCSGLVLYALAQAGIKNVPHLASSQLTMGKSVGTDMAALQPGDLIGMENGGHIGIYLGGGKFIEAPHTGANVRISDLKTRGGWWGVHLNLSGGVTGNAGDTASAVAGLEATTTSNAVNSYPGLSS